MYFFLTYFPPTCSHFAQWVRSIQMPSFVEVSILHFQKVVIGSKYIIITVKMVTTDLLYLGENGNSLSVPNQVNGAVVGQIQTCIPGSQPLLLWNGALSQ